jgi:hypothetical protein
VRPRRSEYNLNTHPDVLNIRTNSGDTNRDECQNTRCNIVSRSIDDYEKI